MLIKRSKVFQFFILSTIFASSLFSQDWVRMMDDPNASFYEVKQAFDSHWEGKEIRRGTGWKQFQRWAYFWEQRVYPHGHFPRPDHVAKEWERYRAQNSPMVLRSNDSD